MATNGSALDLERDKLREKSKFFQRLEARGTDSADGWPGRSSRR